MPETEARFSLSVSFTPNRRNRRHALCFLFCRELGPDRILEDRDVRRDGAGAGMDVLDGAVTVAGKACPQHGARRGKTVLAEESSGETREPRDREADCESHCAINEGEERRCRNAGVGKSFMRALRKTMRANVTAERRNAPDLYAGPGRCFCFVTFYGRCSSSSNGRSASRKGRVWASSGVTQRKSCPSLAAGSPENSVMWKKWSRTARKP